MADRPSALHATRALLCPKGQRWIGALVAAQTAAHAHRGFSLLLVWKGPSFQRPCGNFLCFAAHGGRSRAIPYGARGEVAQSGPSSRPPAPPLIVGADGSWRGWLRHMECTARQRIIVSQRGSTPVSQL